LIDGLSLDISGPTANMANQLADIWSQLARELRLDLRDMLKRQGYGGALPPTVLVPSRSAPPASIPPIVRVDSRAGSDATARPVVTPNPQHMKLRIGHHCCLQITHPLYLSLQLTPHLLVKVKQLQVQGPLGLPNHMCLAPTL
jgi:hypothetical protein